MQAKEKRTLFGWSTFSDKVTAHIFGILNAVKIDIEEVRDDILP